MQYLTNKTPNKWLNQDWQHLSPFVQKYAQKPPSITNLLSRRYAYHGYVHMKKIITQALLIGKRP